MNKATYQTLALLLAGIFSTVIIAADETENDSLKRELTTEELETNIGRMGDVEQIPENFDFSPAEKKLWFADHLANITQPVRLYYEFEKSGSYEDGFSDSVFLDILELNNDGSKNANLDFFTGERKQRISPDNVTNIRGNPVLGVFMQGDVYEMNRLTEGHWRHFQKMIKIALRESASVEETTFTYNGKTVQGQKIIFSPYQNDPHRKDFEKFANKTYEFIFSDQIPGELFQIKTIISAQSSDEPLIEESLTLVEDSSN